VLSDPGREASITERLRSSFQRWYIGGAVLAGVVLKVIALLMRVAGPSPFAGAVDQTGSLAFVIAGVSLAVLLVTRRPQRRLLWHVRRKLTTSYIFIGFVPVLLIIAFFGLGGLLLFFNVSSYLLESRMRTLEDEGRSLAQAAALELQPVAALGEVATAVQRRQTITSARFPEISYAVVPTGRSCPGWDQRATAGMSITTPLSAGPWSHIDAPRALPAWVACGAHATLIAYQPRAAAPAADAEVGSTRVAVRAVAFPDGGTPPYAVVVDIPITAPIARQLRSETGIEIGSMTSIDAGDKTVRPMQGRAVPEATPHVNDASVPRHAQAGWLNRPLNWFSFLDFTDWNTGQQGTLAIAIGMSPADIYRRISATPVRIGNYTFGQVLILLLSFIGGLFLVIEVVAFITGLSLARSITGSVHELFVGTGRVRRGDFTYKIPIRTRDQLGELAESFNSMTTSIENLLQQKEENERRAQELRIARDIQMSLLPQGRLKMPGLALTGYCEPAREVGGDYYDLLPLDDRRLGVLIADVSGKGTSAALYMAELKGLMLSLTQQFASPRELLINANRIISQHLDTRSFITMTYGTVDLDARTFTFARAGHCPLIYLPGPHSRVAGPQILAPDGMVLGLGLDNGRTFERVLREETIPLAPSDLVVLFTDGISEAMNDDGDCFGETRLAQLVEAHRDLPFDELRERIVREVRAFVGHQAPHDDMTMLLVKVEPMGVP
jgi:serine phosphatase RsbU (regulator of sigma subunit)